MEINEKWKWHADVIKAGFILMLGVNACYLNAAEFKEPTSVTQSSVMMHQMKTTKGVDFTVAQYDVPTKNAVPHILAIDKDDYIWFSESGGRFAKNFIDVPAISKVGRLDGNGRISEWKLEGKETSPMGIVFDSKGDLWITERLANRITKMGRNGEVVSYNIPTPNAWPTGIAIDSKDNIWFTETKGDKIGVIYADSGKMAEFPLPATKTMSTGIAVDHDDNVWVAERDVNIIGKFNPSTEKFDQFVLPTPDARPCNVVVDKDGVVWFSERNGGKIGKILPNGAIQEYTLEDRHAGPFIMAADDRGDIWFTQLFANRIGRFEPSTGTFDHYPIPSENSHPAAVMLDSKGNVWFTEQSTNKVSVIIRTDLAYIGGGDLASGGTDVDKHNDKFSYKSFEVPTEQSTPGIIGVDKQNTVWFTEMGGGFVGPGFPPGPPGSAIGYVKDGKIGELPTPTPESGPTSMGFDPKNNDVWVTLRAANKIARIRDFKITEYDIPVEDSLPVGITVDYNHNVWVALSDAGLLARMTPEGKWKTLALPEGDEAPRTVLVTKNNELWFAEKLGNHIGWVDQKKWQAHRWEIPTKGAWPLSLEEDDKGNLWFAQMRADRLGYIDTKTKEISEYKLPSNTAPFKLVFDQPNDALWVSTVFGNSVMRFDLTKKQVIRNYPVPDKNVWVGGLDWDKDKCFWITEQFGNKVDRLCIEGVSLVNN
ncbi:hypothetical protein GCM10007978_23910 [Shewanella hanedai]|jgi:virginiamycin B lyase|uniref:Uncharacterized protein n=1 Tax=Shewanella hanedai TaxID=25 RepID=A0A553JNL1_SHEHA|nr:SMP-30/gluconolactonase/LRE family protein [Shewanella hanedai]TRY14010.1 hypothetical protein FN961_12870 [Shewanella hanedai]GGI85457.1 hypothetical protein GCM10007978_23910 [Shewanella hanedai]